MPKYLTLPAMQCDTNCGLCCGVVACTQGEYEAVQNYASEHGLSPVAQGLTCPWYQSGQCAVHDARPAVCRLFGHTERLECPKGYNVNVSGVLLRKYNERIKAATRVLHEAISGWTIDTMKQDVAKTNRKKLIDL